MRIAVAVAGPALSIMGVCLWESTRAMGRRGALSFLTISLIPMFAVGMLVLGPDPLSLIDHASEGRWVLLIGFCLAVSLVCGTAIERYRQVDR